MENDSGFISSDDKTPFRISKRTRKGDDESEFGSFIKPDESSNRKKLKMDEDESGSSSFTEQEDSTRPNTANITSQSPKKLKICVKWIYGENHHFDTDGRESIASMVKRMLLEADCGKKKPKIEYMLFKSISDDSFLNHGLPTGALSVEECYECIFREKGGKKTKDMIRDYNVEEFDESWNLKSFNVKFEKNKHYFVSDMQRIVDVVRVDFFPGETLFEALLRDGRFTYTKAISKSDFESKDGSKVYLSSEATNDTFKITKRKHQNNQLPLQVHPLQKPIYNLASTVKSEHGTSTEISSKTCLVAHSTPTFKEVEKLPEYCADLKEYFEKSHGLMLEKENDEEREKDRKKKIEKFAVKHYKNFALNYEHRVYVSDLEQTLKLKHSIGAVIAVNGNQDEFFCGTCFRIGEKFVITNYHVVADIYEKGCKLDYVDFSYKEEDGYSFRFESEPILVYSEVLDYAILKLHMDDETFLPPGVTELGYSIAFPGFQPPAKECLSLIGHPGGMKKQIDVSCPFKRQDIEQQYLVWTLRKLSSKDLSSHEQRCLQAAASTTSTPYNVSTFFEGSSGSPGLLMSQKKLAVLHCRGVDFPGYTQRFAVEEGILMSSIVEDVGRQKEGGEVNLLETTLNDIFGPLN